MHKAEGESGPQAARRRLIEKSVRDEGFRAELLSDPKGTVEKELGTQLPEGMEVRVVEETPETIYLVLPPEYTAPREGDELSERELEAVAGGVDDSVPPWYTFYCDQPATRSKKACDPLP